MHSLVLRFSLLDGPEALGGALGVDNPSRKKPLRVQLFGWLHRLQRLDKANKDLASPPGQDSGKPQGKHPEPQKARPPVRSLSAIWRSASVTQLLALAAHSIGDLGSLRPAPVILGTRGPVPAMYPLGRRGAECLRAASPRGALGAGREASSGRWSSDG